MRRGGLWAGVIVAALAAAVPLWLVLDDGGRRTAALTSEREPAAEESKEGEATIKACYDRAPRASKATRAISASPVPKATRVIPAPPGPKATPALRARRATPERQAQRATRVLPVAASTVPALQRRPLPP